MINHVDSSSDAENKPASLTSEPSLGAEYEFHEVADIFPMMADVEFRELVRDIKKNGLQSPIWIYEGKIIDGRNRYRACQTAMVLPRFQEWDGNGSLVDFVVSLNLVRRHLSQSQKAAAAAGSLKLLEEEAKERQKRKPESVSAKLRGQKIGKASEQAGQAFGVGSRYVEEAKKIMIESPADFEKLKTGEKSLSQVKRENQENKSGGAKKADQKKPKQVRDKLGNDVPPDLERFFTDPGEFKPLLRSINDVRKILKKIHESAKNGNRDKIYQYLNTNSLLGTANQVAASIRNATPYVVCPICKGLEYETCKSCCQTGYMSKFRYDSVVAREDKYA